MSEKLDAAYCVCGHRAKMYHSSHVYHYYKLIEQRIKNVIVCKFVWRRNCWTEPFVRIWSVLRHVSRGAPTSAYARTDILSTLHLLWTIMREG